MPRLQYPTRSIEKIFELAATIGADNVILNDAEVGVVLSGGQDPVSASTIANRRWKGTFNVPYQRGTRNAAEYRLSDDLADRERKIRRRA